MACTPLPNSNVPSGHLLQVLSGVIGDEWPSEDCSTVAASRLAVPAGSQSHGQEGLPLSPGHDIAVMSMWPSTIKDEQHTLQVDKLPDNGVRAVQHMPSLPMSERVKIQGPSLRTLSSGEILEGCEADVEVEEGGGGVCTSPVDLTQTSLQQVFHCIALLFPYRYGLC
jgi:hypothetical protein